MKSTRGIAILSLGLSLGAAGLTACTSAPGTRTQTGAILGATAGAVTGLVAGGDARSTAIGGAVGAGVGALVGHELDAQQRALEQSLGGSGASVTNTGAQLVVNLPAAISFASSSAELRPEYVHNIVAVSQNLLAHPNSTVQVVGHTDNTGSTTYNQTLSDRRARAVADVLTSSGVPAWRVTAIGRAYHQPVASNETPEGRALNRRVEIIITPTN